jgi:hypothetical protein
MLLSLYGDAEGGMERMEGWGDGVQVGECLEGTGAGELLFLFWPDSFPDFSYVQGEFQPKSERIFFLEKRSHKK